MEQDAISMLMSYSYIFQFISYSDSSERALSLCVCVCVCACVHASVLYTGLSRPADPGQNLIPWQNLFGEQYISYINPVHSAWPL